MHLPVWRVVTVAILLQSASLSAKIPVPAGKDVLDRYQARTYTDPAGLTLPYRLFKPDNYNPQQKYPLILFLHGSGGCGQDNKTQIIDAGITAVGFASPAIQAQYPCFILVPQCPAERTWADIDWAADSHIQSANPTDLLRMTLEILANLRQEFSIDPQRLYVTGLSIGGFATWDLITRYPTLFAAAVPVCGGGDETKASRILHLPLWVFHGDQDPDVKVARSRNMVSAIRRLGGHALYTEYPHVGHDSWLKAYTDPDLLPWLFSQKRTDK